MVSDPGDCRFGIEVCDSKDRLLNSRAVPTEPLPTYIGLSIPSRRQLPICVPESARRNRSAHLVNPASKSLPNRISSRTHLAVSHNAEFNNTRSGDERVGWSLAIAC